MTIGRVGKSKGVSFRHDEVPYRQAYDEAPPDKPGILIPMICGAIALGGAACMLVGALLSLHKAGAI